MQVRVPTQVLLPPPKLLAQLIVMILPPHVSHSPSVIPIPSHEVDEISGSQLTIHTIHEHSLKEGKDI